MDTTTQPDEAQGKLYRIIYRSIADPKTNAQTLEDILKTAREFNAEHDITGMLVYAEPRFVQVLEGEQKVLQALYQNIIDDPRHSEVTTTLEDHINGRQFEDWVMGFEQLNTAMPQGMLDLSTFITREDITAFNSMGGYQMLRCFMEIYEDQHREAASQQTPPNHAANQQKSA